MKLVSGLMFTAEQLWGTEGGDAFARSVAFPVSSKLAKIFTGSFSCLICFLKTWDFSLSVYSFVYLLTMTVISESFNSEISFFFFFLPWTEDNKSSLEVWASFYYTKYWYHAYHVAQKKSKLLKRELMKLPCNLFLPM